MNIKIGKIYKHYKGKLIKVICIGLNSETNEEIDVVVGISNPYNYEKSKF